MSNTANPSPNPELVTRDFAVPDPKPTAVQQTEDTTMETAGQKKQGEEEALESHEVIELQAFSEKKPWIEERIRLLEEMPPVEVFVGLDAIRVSAEVVPGLPSRTVLEDWVAKHDTVDKELEVFDTVELEKLRKLTKAATHRNLSPADTDVIELTLTTIYALDKLLQLLRDRSEALELLGTRLEWEEHRSAAWVERRQILEDFGQFITRRARWSTSIYETPTKDEHHLTRRGSINSFASASSDTSVTSAAYSRSARFKLAELLSRDAAHFGSRVTALRHGKIASAGKALDKLIDLSRTPVPDDLLDEQDRLEEKGINELEQIGKFALTLVMQWRKADEIHVETMKDQANAHNLLEEIEIAKLHHPTQRQCNSFVSRADALLKRLSVRVNPVATPQFFPHPIHPLFVDQKGFNAQLDQMLAGAIQTAIDLVNKVNISAKQYQVMYEAVRRLDATLEDAIDTTASCEAYLKQMVTGVSNGDGDGSAPNLSSERCLDTTRHTVFLALWPSLSHEIVDVIRHAETILPEFQVSLALFDTSGVRDPDYRSQALTEVRQLQATKERLESAYQNMLVKLDHLREARKIASNIDGIQQRFVELRHQLKEAMENARWRQDTLEGDLPLTPDSATADIKEDTNHPLPDFSNRLAGVKQSIMDEIDTPYALLSHHLETPLREHLSRQLVSLRASVTACEEMISILATLQQQATAMISTREECHALQVRIEDARIRSGVIAGNILVGAVVNGQATDDVAEFHGEVDHLQAAVKNFTDELAFKIPFITRHSLSSSLNTSTSRHRASSIDPNFYFPGTHEAQFDTTSVDAAVRADCNSFTMKLAGEMEGLLKCKHHLALARLSKNLDAELAKTIGQIYNATQELNGWKTSRAHLRRDENYLESLHGLLKIVEDYSTTNRRCITQQFSPLRELLRQMETSSVALDQSIRETLYMTRVRAVDDAELRFATWTENLSLFKSELDQAIRNELFRLDQVKRMEEQRQKEEDGRQKAEEEERRRLEQERRLKEEVEREEAARLAEEVRIQQEKQRLAEMEAEKLRLEKERTNAERRALVEKQEAEAERLRMEQQYSATIEAQQLQSQKERDELASRLKQLEEELNSAKRLQQDQQKSSAEKAAKTVSELEKQRRDLEDLLKEYRDKLETLKALENEVQAAQSQSSKASKTQEIQIMTDSGPDVFTFQVSPVTPIPRTQEMQELEARIHTLRRRLSALGLQEASSSSVNLPTKDQAQRYQNELTAISGEDAKLPASVEDGSTNAVLRSFREDLKAAGEKVQALEKLAELNVSFQMCDAALSDLLEHVDSYPAPPAITMSSFSAPQLASPEDQLSARVRFTKDTISVTEELACPLLSDSRVLSEHSRIMQTWNELSDMAGDRIGGRKSRPGSAISSRGSSGRNSVASVRTTHSATTSGSSHSKKDSYSGLSAPSKPSRPPRGRLLAPPPQPTPPQRRVVSGGAESTPRASSRMSSTSIRSVSGNFGQSLNQPTFSSRQRTTSLSSSTNTTPTLTKRTSNNPLRTRVQTGQQAKRAISPTMSEASSTRSSTRSFATTSRSSRPSIGSGSTWARAPRNSLSGILPTRSATPQKKERPPVRKKYVPNPKSKLDVAVGDVVNNLPVGINIEGLMETWKDQSGKYWIGNQDPKLCFCRILRSQTVMVRVGGGWQELSKFIKDHFADSFRLLSESPPRPGGQEENWISSATLLDAAEITTNANTATVGSPPAPPRTPEPKHSFVPIFSLLTPTGQSPRSIASSPSTKGSPLTPLQFIRRAEPDATLLRPITPTKQSRATNTQAPLRLWRP